MIGRKTQIADLISFPANRTNQIPKEPEIREKQQPYGVSLRVLRRLPSCIRTSKSPRETETDDGRSRVLGLYIVLLKYPRGKKIKMPNLFKYVFNELQKLQSKEYNILLWLNKYYCQFFNLYQKKRNYHIICYF